MSTMNDIARTSQEQILATVKQSEQAVVDAVAAWAKAVEGVVPDVPAVPGAEQLPKPETVVETAFDFAQKLLDAQREFARNVIAAASPVIAKTAPTGSEKPAEAKKPV